MNTRTLCFPGFKHKALTLNYDDGCFYDAEFIEKMRRYGLKGTFNLCGGWMKDGERTGRHLSLQEAQALYQPAGMEVACHGFEHLALASFPTAVMTEDVLRDRREAEKHFEGPIFGFAYAHGSFDDDAVKVLQLCGFHYARTTKVTHDFALPEDWLRMPTSCKHQDPRLFELADQFLDGPRDESYFWRVSNRPRWFTVWGHSYEFNDCNEWELIGRFMERVGKREDVWYCTTGEMYNYVEAFNRLEYSADGKIIVNNSNLDVYLELPDWSLARIPAGQTVKL